ncbi:MAG: CshA/CshB family fibrillar adhesin-related protein [Arachnia sp.]
MEGSLRRVAAVALLCLSVVLGVVSPSAVADDTVTSPPASSSSPSTTPGPEETREAPADPAASDPGPDAAQAEETGGEEAQPDEGEPAAPTAEENNTPDPGEGQDEPADDSKGADDSQGADDGDEGDQGATPAEETPDAGRPSKDDAVEETTDEKTDDQAAREETADEPAQITPFDIGPLAVGDGCSYADVNTGSYARTLCWIDLKTFTTRYTDRGSGTNPRYVSAMGQAYGTATSSSSLYSVGGVLYGPVTNYPISVELSASHILEARLSVSSTATNAGGVAARAVGLPSWTGAFLGNGSFYTGVSGNPALYQVSGGSTTVTLSQIKVRHRTTNVNSTGYAIVVADAESTDTNESITWTHSGGKGFRWLPNNPAGWAAATTAAARKTAAVGNACAGTANTQFPAANGVANTRACSAGTNQASGKTGTAMLQISPNDATSAFSVTQTMVGGGLQAVAFGVVLGGGRVTVDVDDRIVDAAGAPTGATFQGQFGSTESGTFTAETGSTALTATTDSQYVPLSLESTTQLTFSSTVTGAAASSYRASWVCYRSTPDSTTQTRWPTTGSSSTPPSGTNAQVKGGEFIDCTVTYTPPYLSLVKVVTNGTTGATHVPANFTLTATGPVSAISGAGNAAAAVTKRPVAIGSYALTEAVPTGTTAWRFGYTWTNLTCTGATPTLTRDPDSTAVTAATVAVGALGDVTCRYTNVANEPRPRFEKTSIPASGQVVTPGQLITYVLTFDNTLGSAAEPVDHIDHLRDVLDDATFVAGSIRYGNGTGTPSATSPLAPGVTALAPDADGRIVLTGTVPARSTRTVSFQVQVLPNDDDAADRQDAAAPLKGYQLRNYLTASDTPAPATCEAPAEGHAVTCTEHPVRAWTIRKGSQPEDGAKIHSGGNIYYRVTITPFGGEDVTGVQISDDLTETLAAATWDPTAPAAVPVAYGLSFYDADDQLIGSQPWAAATGPRPVFSGSAAFDDDFPGGRPFPGGRWTFTTPAFTIPAQMAGSTVAYAVVGYVVRGGAVASPADPTSPYATTAQPAGVRTQPHATWVNTVQAGQATIGGVSLYPNRCSAEDGDLPEGWQDTPDFLSRYGACKTYHFLGDSYFHVWKKDGTLAPGNQANNLRGASFLLADTEQDARTGQPSRWLCRAANNPYDGGAPAGVSNRPAGLAYAAPGSDPAVSGAEDFGADSATSAAIAAWNAAHPDDQRATCGLFFALDEADEGQAAGSWRAVDVRGGDTAVGGGPLANWRTASALNVAGDASSGRHGTYWLAETRSPDDFQLLAQPMRMWVAPAAPAPSGLTPGQHAWYDYQGRLSLPIVGIGEDVATGFAMTGPKTVDDTDIRASCSDPWTRPAGHQPACVMPTGWTMPVFDVKLRPLPRAGGTGANFLTTGALAVLAASIVGTAWWRRHRLPTGGGDP